jgi:hypothetical protein
MGDTSLIACVARKDETVAAGKRYVTISTVLPVTESMVQVNVSATNELPPIYAVAVRVIVRVVVQLYLIPSTQVKMSGCKGSRADTGWTEGFGF